jgi:hypothetical protein
LLARHGLHAVVLRQNGGAGGVGQSQSHHLGYPWRLAHHTTTKLVMATMNESIVQFSTGRPNSKVCPTNQFTQGPPSKSYSYLDYFWQSKT